MAGALACALVALTASSASALVVHGHNGHFLGIELHRGIKASAVSGSIAAQQPAQQSQDNGVLSYHGGPVVHSSAPYLIFWVPSGQSIAASSQTLMKRYFTDVAADSKESDDVYGVTRQYTDATGFAGGGQAFNASAQALIDTQPYPATDTTNCPGTAYPKCLTDAQLQQELERLVATKALPTDGPSGAAELPQNAPIYFIVLPGDVNVCDSGVSSGTTTACASNAFCAYHSSMTDGSNTLLYAAIPMLLAETQPKSCQFDGNSAVQEPNADPADVVIGDVSHEDNETISDPLGTSWWDSTSGNEEADGCTSTGSFSPANDTDPNAFLPTIGGAASAGTLYDQLINSNRYYTQSEWSNGDLGCRMQPAAGTITPSFTVSGTTAPGSSLSFNPSASTSTYAISSETWDFGDGSTQAFHTGGSTSVSHTYTADGTYTATLTLVDNRGDLQSTTQQVTIGPRASFTYSPSSPLEGTSVSFDGSGSSDPDPGGQIASYAWSFGDGGTSTVATPSHTYATYGTYTVKLTVADNNGTANTTSQQITVDDAPTATFTIAPNPAVAGHPVVFNGEASKDPDGTISSYAWNFGDGATGTGAALNHTYGAAGTYSITLTVTDSNGQTSTVTAQLNVSAAAPTGGVTPPVTPAPPPTAGFAVTTPHPAAQVPVRFSGASSRDPNGSITSYSWSFGDGAHGSGVDPVHTYRTAGTYRVSLTVVASSGTSASISSSVVVLPGSRISKISISAHRGSELLAIALTGPGRLSVGTRRFVIARAETIKIRLAPTASQRRALQRTRRLTATVVVAFAPQIGRPTSSRVRVRFVRSGGPAEETLLER